jgi:6-phosphogluconolactonase (cycloisomerase 2 family)
MASGTFHEADLDDLDKLNISSYETGGKWSKVVRFSPSGKSMAISNWESRTVTVFDYKTKNKVATFKNAHIPRGIVWLSEDRIAVTIFGDENAHKSVGGIEVFDILSGEKFTLPVPHGMRDIKYDSKRGLIFASSMRFGSIYKIDLKKCNDINEWQKDEQKRNEFIEDCVSTLKVDDKANTIQLNAEGTRLYVSCRGPNNPRGYTLRSPRSGYLYEIDTSEKEMKILKAWQGGNQPTGLALSADGKYLAATDFMDARLTVYKLDSIKE